MNYLTGKRCYLSGPIEQDTGNTNWRTTPKAVLTERYKLNLFDPFCDPKQQLTDELYKARETRDFETITRIAKSFVRKDLTMVDHTHITIAYLPYKVPTCGTHHEIINSNNQKKPTLLVCTQGKQYVPLWYFGFIPHEFMFDSWEDLYKYLDAVDAGKHMDNNRWWIVCGLV